jgi:hypothetical protein
MSTELDDILVGPTELGRWLDVSDEWVRRLQHDGVFKQKRKGLYPLRESVTAYAQWQRDEQRRSSQSAAQVRLIDAKAKREELRRAREEKELIPLTDAEAATDAMISIWAEEVSGQPARFTRDLDLRRQLEDYNYAMRERIADRIQALGETYLARSEAR